MKQEKEKKGLPFFGIPKLAPYLKPYKMLFFWMVVTGTVGSGMDAIIPLFQQHAIDHFIADKTMQGVGGWLALYILVMIIQTATNYISRKVLLQQAVSARKKPPIKDATDVHPARRLG